MNKQKAQHVLRTIIIFIVLVVLCYIGGFYVGKVSAHIRQMDLDIPAMKELVYERLSGVIPAICFVILLVLETVLQAGLVPIMLVGIIWLTNVLAFVRESKKLDK